MGKNIGKNISKNLSSIYSQNVLIMLNNRPQMHLKLLLKKEIQKTEEVMDDLIGNKILKKITKENYIDELRLI